MQYTFFRIPSSCPDAAARELNQFAKSHSVTHIEKHFHSDGDEGYWSFCLQWQEVNQTPSTSKFNSKIDYKAVLSEEQFTVYSQLRECRKELALQDGVPVYSVASNEHLAEMVRGRRSSKSQLAEISGFGASKVERYGDMFLDVLKRYGAPAKDDQAEEMPVASANAHKTN